MLPVANRFNQARHEFGIQNQTALLPFLENYLGEKIIETKKFYDTIDGKTETKDIEIKTRTPKYHYTDRKIVEEGWLIPACKIQHARESERPFVCFYYWKSDESVWEFVYTEEKLKGLKPFTPSWHKEKQLHYTLPQHLWTKLTK
jgi:hypothetical protein